jgi:hypothetical protein
VTLFVHGYQFDGSAHCPDKFAYGQQRLRDFGQTGVFHTVKFYGNDTGCTKDIHAFGEHNEHFSSPGGGHEDGHTTDTDIRHLAYHLAKMIYHDYSKHGIYVQIISHSMGGLITRYALAQAEAGNPDFPPYLLVQDVATLGTPHAGVKATTYFCRDSQKQCRQMTAGSEFLLWLYQNAQHPDGYPATDWTNMASYEDQLVDEESATAMGADHKVIYWGGEENRPRIGHSGYMEDGPDTRDAHVYWRDAGQSWFAWKEGPHAIRWIDHSIYHYSW